MSNGGFRWKRGTWEGGEALQYVTRSFSTGHPDTEKVAYLKLVTGASFEQVEVPCSQTL